MKFNGVACLGALLLGTACRWTGLPIREKIFAAHEEGLTLLYENPQLGAEARKGERIQVRVAASRETEGGRAVRLIYTTLHGELSANFIQKGGGLFLGQDDKSTGVMVFPIGFPDSVSSWEVRGTKFRVLGRAVVDLHGLKLPDTADRVGVWVESQSPQGMRQRTFLLPDIGEVETLLWREGGWFSANRLVSRGFTDAPPTQKSL